MTRHGRNATANSVYSYNERKKDSKSSGYGSQTLRMSKHSVKDFDCCCLTMQPCVCPMITPDGYLYDKESILEYIITSKREIERKTKEYHKWKEEQKLKESKDKVRENDQKKRKYAELEASIVSRSHKVQKTDTSLNDDKKLNCFWIPSLTPEYKISPPEPPSKIIVCPMSGKPLKFKDLIEIKFEPALGVDPMNLAGIHNRYICPVSGDYLGNSVPCAVLKTSGVVMKLECIKTSLKIDKRDPINGKLIEASDIINLKKGASGFSALEDNNLKAACKNVVMQAF